MLNCEQFENRFLLWKKGGLSESEGNEFETHYRTCPHCNNLTTKQANLRSVLTSGGSFRPKAGFEMRLENAIKNGTPSSVRVNTRKSNPFGRLTALGAGLATGLAVGFVVLTSPDDPNVSPTNQIVEQPSISSPVQLAENKTDKVNSVDDTLLAGRDSLPAGESNYDASRFNKMVSGR